MGKSIKQTFGERAADFFISLDPDFELPEHFEFLLPYQSAEVKSVTKKFFSKYYSDNKKRIFILGINPGRFGAGSTGIAFTDPVALKNECGIKNSLESRSELSSSFIYEMINKSGGVRTFYNRFFLTAICPIGFVKLGKNINYYDDYDLLKSSRNFIIESLNQQISFGAQKRIAICLGEGKNYKYLSELNDKLNLFEEIEALAHPRYIMQYKRKKIHEYIDKYIDTMEKAVQKSSV